MVIATLQQSTSNKCQPGKRKYDYLYTRTLLSLKRRDGIVGWVNLENTVVNEARHKRIPRTSHSHEVPTVVKSTETEDAG